MLSKTEKILDSVEKRQAIDHLNSQLMDVTTLYGDFADELDLHECKLAILHCAGHYDVGLIESLWRSIISEGARARVCVFALIHWLLCQVHCSMYIFCLLLVCSVLVPSVSQ